MGFFGEGRTIEEALQQISDEHEVSLDELDYEVLEQKRRILGLFGEETVSIRAWRKTEKDREPIEVLQKICSMSGLACQASVLDENEDMTVLNISGEDLGMIIGKNGEVLDAFQYLTRKIVNRGGSDPRRIIVDADGYRDRKIANLKRLALRSAKQVKETGKSLVLDPMNAHDRRVVHLELKEDQTVFTKSLGDGNLKKVMIALKKSRRSSANARHKV